MEIKQSRFENMENPLFFYEIDLLNFKIFSKNIWEHSSRKNSIFFTQKKKDPEKENNMGNKLDSNLP